MARRYSTCVASSAKQAHPILDRYMPRAKDGPDWKSRRAKVLGDLTIELRDLETRAKAVQDSHGGWESAAAEFGRRCWKHLGNIELHLIPVFA